MADAPEAEAVAAAVVPLEALEAPVVVEVVEVVAPEAVVSSHSSN